MQVGKRKILIALCSIVVFSLTILFLILLFHKEVFSMQISFTLISFVTFFSLLDTYHLNALSNKQAKKKNILILWRFLFLFYIVELGYLLFFSSEFSRDYINEPGVRYIELLQFQWTYGKNLIPFKTIHMMFDVFSNPYVGNAIAIINIFGNIIAFMPFVFFSLLLSKSMQNTLRFVLTISKIIVLVELIQFFTLTGTLDIDDYILNFSGAMLFYMILRTPFCTSLLAKLRG